MSIFKISIFALESDFDSGLYLGRGIYTADNEMLATNKAYDDLWDERLSITCSPRFEVEEIDLDVNPEDLADFYLDAAPENTDSVDNYTWTYRTITRQEMEATGLLRNFDEHAKNINLNPTLSDLTRPVVVTYGDGTRNPLEVWDGVHRLMSALDLDVQELPAVVGTKLN